MAGRGGIRSTSFKKGSNPIKAKGTKHKKTILKEAIGLKNWDSLKEFIEGKGAGKLVTEMNKLTGRNYVIAYSTLAEFVKPKLARTTLEGDPNKPLFTQPLSDAQIDKVLSEIRKIHDAKAS